MRCLTAAGSIGSYFLELEEIGLWPTAECLRSTNVEDFLRALDNFADIGFTRCKNSSCSLCSNKSSSLRAMLFEARENVRRNNKGLCLDCVRTGRKSFEQKGCRVKHD